MPEDIDFDPLDRLESLLDRIQEAKDRHRLGDALDTAIRAVNGAGPAIARLENLAGFAPLVAEFLDLSDLGQCRQLLTEVRGIGAHFCQASDAAALEQVTTKASQLPGHISQADSFLQRGWRAKIVRAFATNGRLGIVLREIPETGELGKEMEALLERSQRLAASTDDAEQCAKQFSALETERDAAKEKLALLGAGDEVVQFLLAVATRAATLAHVTRGVRQWLDEHTALNRFKVEL